MFMNSNCIFDNQRVLSFKKKVDYNHAINILQGNAVVCSHFIKSFDIFII